MSIEKDTIRWIMDLAKLNLSEEEQAHMGTQLTKILDYMEVLNELGLSEVEPMAHTLGYKNVTREDRVEESLDVEIVRAIAPEWSNGHVVVPRVL